MKKNIYFGEVVDGYSVRVLNEREARAGAGILFLFAFMAFMNSYISHNFIFTQIFVTVFMIDFIVRIFINPKFAPSLILGRIMVKNQTPEYVGATQKKWAWFIGLHLSVIMFLLIVVFNIMTPVKIIICLVCLTLLYSESVFGICLGCKIFNYIHDESPKHCPGGVCEIREKDEVQKVSLAQKMIISIFLAAVIFTTYALAFSIKEVDDFESFGNETESVQTSQPKQHEHGKCSGG